MSDIIAEQAERVALAIFDRMERASGSGDPILRSEIESIVTGGMRAVAGLRYEIALENAPPPRAPDWEDLYARYYKRGHCNCPAGNPPCSYCVDGWVEGVDWDYERVTTGYVRGYAEESVVLTPKTIDAALQSLKNYHINPKVTMWSSSNPFRTDLILRQTLASNGGMTWPE